MRGNAGAVPRVVVFVDEASLPDEKKNVLKVLHSYLDECTVAFVCISNQSLDAANANRMVQVHRSVAELSDLVVLALGCAGIEAENANQETRLIITGVCSGYLKLIKLQREVGKFEMHHYRDLIHTFRHLNRQGHGGQLLVSPIDLLRALEENFNGVSREVFRQYVETFFREVQEQVGGEHRFRIPPDHDFRDDITILRGVMTERLHVGDDMAARFKLFINPTGQNIVPVLMSCGILPRQGTRVFRMSDYAADQTDLHAAETISELTLSMESAGCNVLINTERINDSLYDLFNQNFRKTASSEVFCNVAIGTRTHPKPVNSHADFVVIVDAHSLTSIPAPFLSRFSKFLLDMDSFLKLKVDRIVDPVEKEATVRALERVPAFVEHIGARSFHGLMDPQQTIPILFLSHFEDTDSGCILREHSVLTKQAASVAAKHFPTASRAEQIVRAMCTRLLQVCPPELFVLKLSGLDPASADYYVET